jgi:hypothetical protein
MIGHELHIRPALAVLIALYLGAIVSANAVAARLFVVFGVHVTSGAVAIPIVYLTTDIVNELYGRRTTRAVVWMGALSNALLVGTIALANVIPASPLGVNDGAFRSVFDITWRVVLGSTVAYLISSLLDVEIFHVLRKLTKEKAFWLRKNGSTVISQAVDTGIFILIAFGGIVPMSALIPMAIGQYCVKISAAPLGTPLSYAVLWIARRFP